MYGPRDVQLNPIVPPALCVLEDVKTSLGVSGSGMDAVLTARMVAAAVAIETYCGQPIAERDVTERIQAIDSASGVILRNAPANTLTSVEFNRVALTPSDFRLSGSYATLRKVDGSVFGPGEWVFVYKAGYPAGSIPSTIASAAVLLTAHIHQVSTGAALSANVSKESSPDVGSVEYATIEDRTLTRNGATLPADIALLLCPYVREF